MSHTDLLYQKQKRRRNFDQSSLDEVKGIGQKNKNELLRYFVGIKSIKKASLKEITSVNGIGHKKAELIYNFFNIKIIMIPNLISLLKDFIDNTYNLGFDFQC